MRTIESKGSLITSQHPSQTRSLSVTFQIPYPGYTRCHQSRPPKGHFQIYYHLAPARKQPARSGARALARSTQTKRPISLDVPTQVDPHD